MKIPTLAEFEASVADEGESDGMETLKRDLPPSIVRTMTLHSLNEKILNLLNHRQTSEGDPVARCILAYVANDSDDTTIASSTLMIVSVPATSASTIKSLILKLPIPCLAPLEYAYHCCQAIEHTWTGGSLR